MAAAKKTAASKPEKPEAQAAKGSVDEVHARGGWDVGYTGDRVDETPNEAYSVSGVLRAAEADDGDE